MRTLLVGLALCVMLTGCAQKLNQVGCVSFDNSTKCPDEGTWVQEDVKAVVGSALSTWNMYGVLK